MLSITLFIIFTSKSNISAVIFGITSFGFLWLATVPPTVGIVGTHIWNKIYWTTYMVLVFLSHQIGSFFGAYLGSVFREVYGSYDYAWYV